MKTIFTSIILLFAFTYCSAQASATTDEPISAKGTQIKVDSTVINFGTLQQGAVVKKVVTFTNTGKRELIFSACTAPTKSVEVRCPAEAIRPGQSGSVQVTYTADKLGKFKEKFDLVTNAVNGNVTITVKGNVSVKPEMLEGAK